MIAIACAGFSKVAARTALSCTLLGLALTWQGCGSGTTVGARAEQEPEVTPEEQAYLNAARPFAEAIASGAYSNAFNLLSTHAQARMSPSQFVAPEDDASEQRNQAAAVRNPGSDRFTRMMTATEAAYGRPAKLAEMDVFSTDPAVLSGNATSAEDKLEAIFAIGMMPDSIPAGIRKASLRSKLAVELSPTQLAQAAKTYQTTPDKLKSDPDFDPYVTLKMVLVEEAGALKVGYFEFLPPGLFD